MKPTTLIASFLFVALVPLVVPGGARAEEAKPRPPLAAGEIELRLGDGVFGRVTPPAGWTRATAYDHEQCWNASGNDGSFCVGTSWKRGRSAKQILDESLAGIKCTQQEDKDLVEGPVVVVRRECVVQVGPRREGRMWLVFTHALARDAVAVSVHLSREDKPFLDTIARAIDSFRFVQ